MAPLPAASSTRHPKETQPQAFSKCPSSEDWMGKLPESLLVNPCDFIVTNKTQKCQHFMINYQGKIKATLLSEHSDKVLTPEGGLGAEKNSFMYRLIMFCLNNGYSITQLCLWCCFENDKRKGQIVTVTTAQCVGTHSSSPLILCCPVFSLWVSGPPAATAVLLLVFFMCSGFQCVCVCVSVSVSVCVRCIAGKRMACFSWRWTAQQLASACCQQ